MVNTIGAASGAGATYPFSAPKFKPMFSGVLNVVL